MVESIDELRRRVQEPVRKYNDISGMLLGDHVSIYITRFFIARGWSPTVATVSMLVCGLAGAALLPLGHLAAVAGFVLLVLYYIFDCVDGEVARYHRVEKVFWSFHDYLFHLYVKSAFFLALGVSAFRVTGSVWMFGVAWLGFSCTIFSKTLRELPSLLATRLVLLRGSGPDDRSYRQLTEHIRGEDLADRSTRDCGSDEPPNYGGLLSKVRSILTNLDLMSIAFLAAAIGDVFLPRFGLFGRPFNLQIALFVAVTAILTLDFLDRLLDATRKENFRRDAGALLLRAHHFRIRRERTQDQRTQDQPRRS